MVKKKKLFTVLLVLALVGNSRQEDYEEIVFLNKCELDTAKIMDNFKVSTNSNKEIVKAVAAAKKEMNATLAELRKLIVEEFEAQARKTEKMLARLYPCEFFKPTLANLKVKKLSTGAYFYHDRDLNHSAAGAWCKERGMRLAQFETLEEMEVVLKNVPSLNGGYWLGASDVGFAHGDFHWSDGAKVETGFWYSGRPNSHSAGNETCVATSKRFKKLGDAPCIQEWPLLCEVPPEFSGCF